MFLWERKLEKKEGTEKNYVITLDSLKSGFICQRKKNYFKDLIQKFNLNWKCFPFTRPKKVLEIIPVDHAVRQIKMLKLI